MHCICSYSHCNFKCHRKSAFLADLDGSLTLMPRILSALETVLPTATESQLRGAAIHILATMLPFPARYGDAEIKDILPTPLDSPPQVRNSRVHPLKRSFDENI